MNRVLITIVLVAVSAFLLVSANSLLATIDIPITHHPFTNGIAKYQMFAFVLALVAALLTVAISPQSRQLISFGDVRALAEKERWLGIDGQTSWKRNGLQLLVIISLATIIFMALAVRSVGKLDNFSVKFLPWILLFSFTNAVSEELIFRFAVNGNLLQEGKKYTPLLISGILFGLPHYNGYPNGIVGVVMAGVLGYVLSKATFETRGLGIALGIHFVQDVIIFTSLFMINATL